MHHANQSANAGKISTYNSSTDLLLAAATYTGTWEDVQNYASISILAYSDVAGTLYADFSIDGQQTDRAVQLSSGSTADMGIHSLIPVAKLFRVRVVNGGSNQTSFRLQTIYNEKARIAQPTSRLSQTIGDYSDVLNCRSVLVAQNQNGVYGNIKSDLYGALKIADGNTTSSGESITVQYRPVSQTTYFYGITDNPQRTTQFTASGGTITGGGNNNVKLSIDATVGAYAVQRSARLLRYRHGLSNICRFGAKFSAGVANSLQFGGLGNSGSDLYFCMNGTDFGIRRSYGGELHVVRLTMSAAASGVESLTITLNSVAFNISTSTAGGAISFTAHQVEIGGTGATTYTGWNTEHFGNTVTFIGASVGARSGTYSFVNNTGGGTAAGSFSTINTGSALTTQFIAQADWDGPSPMKTNLDPISYSNLYEIEYLWYGSSNIIFKVYNPDTGEFEVVHTLEFANQTADLSLTAPNMYVQLGCASLGSTTALDVYSSGYFTSTLGEISIKRLPKSAVSNSKAIAPATETVILALTNRKIVNDYANQCEILLNNLSLAADGNRPVVIKCIKNPSTLGADTTADYTNFQYDDVNYSLLGYDTTTDTYTGGNVLFQEVIPKNGGLTLDVFSNEFFLGRDDIIIFTAYSTQANTVDISCSIINDY